MTYDVTHSPLSKEQQEALTLSEEDYFTFARYMDRLIPAYVVKQLHGHGFALPWLYAAPVGRPFNHQRLAL